MDTSQNSSNFWAASIDLSTGRFVLGPHLGNDLLRRIYPETRDFGQPLDCILMLPEKTCDLLSH